MRRKSMAEWPCSIARTADLLGDTWSMLILREACYGITRFDRFQAELGIARNTLADRLDQLTNQGMLERRRYQEDPPRDDYVLTEKGADFFPVLAAMATWGDRWLDRGAGRPIDTTHLRCGHRTHAEVVCAECAEPLTLADTNAQPGPGFPARLLQRPAVRERFDL